MQAYLQQFTKTIGFSAEATDYFCSLYARVAASSEATERLEYLQKRLNLGRVLNNTLTFLNDLCPALDWLAQFLGVHRYTADMLSLLAATPALKERYRFLGFDDAFFYENMQDLQSSLTECYKVHQIWGTAALDWFLGTFSMQMLLFGRFHYERIPFTKPTYTFGEQVVKTGSMVFNIHIPAMGPLTKEARMDSYRRIYNYVKPQNGVLPITCTSWLLCPNLLEICRADSNMVGFLTDFDSIDRTYPTPQQPFLDAWRVFGMDYTGNTDLLPRNTDLQRRIADWLAAGKGIGKGTGILLFDGEKIINKK